LDRILVVDCDGCERSPIAAVGRPAAVLLLCGLSLQSLLANSTARHYTDPSNTKIALSVSLLSYP